VNLRKTLTFFAAILIVAMAACQPSTVENNALRTSVAAEILDTLTAAAPPPATVEPPTAPTPTSFIPPTPTEPASSPAVVTAANLNLREGPATLYNSISLLSAEDSLAVLGQSGECSWLKVRTQDGVEGWVKAGAGFVSFETDCKDIPNGTLRLPTGQFILDKRTATGTGTLTVQNGAMHDALVLLQDEEKNHVVAYYVRSGENYRLQGIPDGRYVVFFAIGEAWDGENQKFTIPADYKKLADVLVFETNAGVPPSFSIALQAEKSRAGSLVDMQAIDFPALK